MGGSLFLQAHDRTFGVRQNRTDMSNYLEFLPSDRLRVGQCEVDVPLREVHAPGARRPVRITPKSMGVLRVLVDNAGKVVSRDTLLAGVWPDTMPTNDVVTQAVTQLRKAFGPADGAPPYIETIAKGGYRLLAEVEWLPSPPAAVAETMAAVPQPDRPGGNEVVPSRHDIDIPAGARQQRAGWGAMVGATLVALVLAGLLYGWSVWHSKPVPSPTAPQTPVGANVSEPRLITSSPGFEWSPSLSPDASMVAYRAVPRGQRNIAIMVQTTTPTPPRQLTRPDGQADDVSPAWSPDGREIAFLRVVQGERCEIRVVSASGGADRVVGQCDEHYMPSFDWTPNGKGLVFGSHGISHDRPGLQRLDLDTGRLSTLEEGASPLNHDFAPRYSPDGRWIVFVRNTPLGDFWRLPATGGTAERLTHLNAQIRGWDWDRDGRALVYSRHHDNESRLYRLDLDTGVHVELGITDAEDPVIAADAPALAYVQRTTWFGVYRFDLDGDGPGERMFRSSGRDRLPAIAPDGRQLAFVSDRSGEYRLWWADVDNPDSLRLLDGLRPESRYLPRWSADSQRLLVVGRGIDSAGTASPGVYEVEPASGRMTRLALPVEEPLQAIYMPDPTGSGERVLVVSADRRGRLHVDLLDHLSDGWKRVGRLDDVSRIEVDAPGARVLFARPAESGLWQADLQLDPGSVRQVDSTWPTPERYRSWTAAPGGGVYGIERTAGCSALLDVHGAAAGGAPRCLDVNRRAATYGLSLDPRSNRLYVTLVEYDASDIGFAKYDPPAEALWPGVGK
ncbi:winged helix-turn-helix domain-containing protein [Lysobacter sp. F6437]|uniref:winged helix-turn-helix domain-containing protein n=1 Tax=Lysobacter sp. F6437 TaxID=3459296 RepID=UPI00403DDE17